MRLISVVLTLLCSVQALHRQRESSILQDKTTELEAECQDDETQHDIGPIVKSMSSFFEEKGATLYPWALTGLGALRFGGISLKVEEQSKAMDHDLDFLLLPKTKVFKSNVEAQELVEEWQKKLKQDLDLGSRDITGAFSQAFNLDLKGELLSDSGPEVGMLNHIFLLVEKKSSVGHQMRTSDWEPKQYERQFNNRHSETWKQDHKDSWSLMEMEVARSRTEAEWGPIVDKGIELLKGGAWMAEEVVGTVAGGTVVGKASRKAQLQLGKEAFVDHVRLTDASLKELTIVDFFYKVEKKHGKLDDGFAAHPTKKTLFMNTVFPYPANEDKLFDSIKGGFLEDSPVAKTNSICEMQHPRMFFEEEFPSSKKINKLIDQCTGSLHEKGFASLHECTGRAFMPSF